MTTHDLKTWPAVFDAMAAGLKTFEYRKDDRGYAVGDVLRLRRYDSDLWIDAVADGSTPEEATDFAYTGEELLRRVTYLVRGGQFGIPEGYVIMAVEEAPHVTQ